MKKFLLLPALAFCSLAAQAADPALSFEGDGTAASPYLIKTADDVIALATACNGATSTTSGHYAGKYFSLTADIDMAGKSGFYGIATAPADKATSTGTYHFDGIFDGCGYRIKNMKINGVVRKDDGSVNTSTGANGSRRYCGFFGAIGTGGKVSNLVIDASCRIEAYSYVGGVVGNLGTEPSSRTAPTTPKSSPTTATPAASWAARSPPAPRPAASPTASTQAPYAAAAALWEASWAAPATANSRTAPMSDQCSPITSTPSRRPFPRPKSAASWATTSIRAWPTASTQATSTP